MTSHDAVTDADVCSDFPQQAVSDNVRARAQRLFHPGGYEITGFVMTQKISQWRAVVDSSGTRYMSSDDMKRLMAFEPPTGSGTDPDVESNQGETTGATLASTPTPAPPPVVAAAVPERKPALAAPPTHVVPDDVEAAYGLLARRLGCHYNEAIPHNSGWFVPGNQVAFASALDAIEALVAHLKSGGTVYVGSARGPQNVAGSGASEGPSGGPADGRKLMSKGMQEPNLQALLEAAGQQVLF
ncbi:MULTISPECIES: hypothetical protein [unclassified Burkholderia]|uniref:hypothetical protein n=1 Tax=unclassified Burkholderia TaxID=2613784 RepID=UPI002AB06090|nr:MULTISPECIES: hypothetical protein [unclassified Burkholderia]